MAVLQSSYHVNFSDSFKNNGNDLLKASKNILPVSGNMRSLQKTKAAEMAIAISWEYAELSDVIEWADEQISQSDAPDDRMIDLSLASSKGEAAGILRSISKGTDEWLNLSYFLNRFYLTKNLDSTEASKLAKQLYTLTVNSDAPEQFICFVSHWDAIDLAVDGMIGDPDECIQIFLSDIRKAVASNGGPKFEALI